MNQHRYTNLLYVKPKNTPTIAEGIGMMLAAGIFGFVAACLYGAAAAI